MEKGGWELEIRIGLKIEKRSRGPTTNFTNRRKRWSNYKMIYPIGFQQSDGELSEIQDKLDHKRYPPQQAAEDIPRLLGTIATLKEKEKSLEAENALMGHTPGEGSNPATTILTG